ncbi:unnamed protein product [Ectocarpus sp. CCAP 1310/34]|nr:unnamed protein product [Ectocarpus sp. CCAP 1310/34]
MGGNPAVNGLAGHAARCPLCRASRRGLGDPMPSSSTTFTCILQSQRHRFRSRWPACRCYSVVVHSVGLSRLLWYSSGPSPGRDRCVYVGIDAFRDF